MGFERVIILQPAFLLRDHRSVFQKEWWWVDDAETSRDESVHARPYEHWSNAIFGLMRRVRLPTRDWAVQVEE